MGFTVESGVMPKSNAGRKPLELDAAFVSALAEALMSNPMSDCSDDDGDAVFLPNYFGPKEHWLSTEGKAQGEGRRYRDAIVKANPELKDGLRVSVADNAKSGNERRYTWRVYRPLNSIPEAAEDTPAETPKA